MVFVRERLRDGVATPTGRDADGAEAHEHERPGRRFRNGAAVAELRNDIEGLRATVQTPHRQVEVIGAADERIEVEGHRDPVGAEAVLLTAEHRRVVVARSERVVAEAAAGQVGEGDQSPQAAEGPGVRVDSPVEAELLRTEPEVVHIAHRGRSGLEGIVPARGKLVAREGGEFRGVRRRVGIPGAEVPGVRRRRVEDRGVGVRRAGHQADRRSCHDHCHIQFLHVVALSRVPKHNIWIITAAKNPRNSRTCGYGEPSLFIKNY
jgi:hypothetical protein